MTASVPAGVAESQDRVTGTPSYRHDLDGLRAFAIALVVAYHIWVGRVSGGVDVFLILSAYFMTASLVRRADAPKPRLRLARWYVHRFWRLVPAAALVIVAILVATLLWFPPSIWQRAWDQAIASVLYFQNWELALNSVDYYNRDANSVTPFLHFWSLSIQGQVFVIWPLLILLCLGIARLLKVRTATVALVAFLLVFGASLTYSVITTNEAQGFAYFDTFARLWEFAAGSLVALIPASFALRRPLAEVLGWLAVLGVLTCGIVLDVAGGFPGYLALWPVLCTAALIVAGRTATTVTALLGSRAMRWLGRIAYPLYLVHWPLLVLWIVRTGEPLPDLLSGALIIAASLVLATIIAYTFERPLTRWKLPDLRPWVGVLGVAVCIASVLVPVSVWRHGVEQHEAAVAAAAEAAAQELRSSPYPGAAIVDADPADVPDFSGIPSIPLGTTIDTQWVTLEGGACTGSMKPKAADLAGRCFQQNADAEDVPTIVIVGDSHAEQFMGSIMQLSDDHPARLFALLYGACRFAPDDDADDITPACITFRTEAMDYLLEHRPDIVVIIGTRTTPDTPDEYLVPGIEKTVQRLVDNGSQVVSIRDNARFSENMFTCGEVNPAPSTACDRDVRDVMAASDPQADLADIDGAHIVDLTDWICPSGVCTPVVGNVGVFMDDNHLSWDYSRTLAPMVGEQLAAAGLEWPDTGARQR